MPPSSVFKIWIAKNELQPIHPGKVFRSQDCFRVAEQCDREGVKEIIVKDEVDISLSSLKAELSLELPDYSGLASRVFTAISAGNLNIIAIAIAQGSSELALDGHTVIEAITEGLGQAPPNPRAFATRSPDAGAEKEQFALVPLYDLLCTIYYPELSRDMAMKIGGEYSSANVTPQNFEWLAQDSGVSKPMVRLRVSELAGIVATALAQADTSHSVASAVAALIRQCCEGVRNRFLG